MPEIAYPAEADEINLFELIQIIKCEWKTWVSATAIGAALGTSVAFSLPPKYEASAIVRVGQVGQVTAGSTVIEALPDVVERLQSPAFRRSVAEQLLGKSADGEALTQEMNRLKATPAKLIKGTNLVEINTQGKTPDEALKAAQLILQNLKERHRPLFEQALAQLQSRLAETTQNLTAIDKGCAAGGAANPAQGGAFVQLAQLTESGRYATLRNQQLAIENALLPLNTRPTDTIEPISVSDRPVSPKKGLIAAIGVLAGAMLGLLLVFSKRIWHKFKTP